MARHRKSTFSFFFPFSLPPLSYHHIEASVSLQLHKVQKKSSQIDLLIDLLTREEGRTKRTTSDLFFLFRLSVHQSIGA